MSSISGVGSSNAYYNTYASNNSRPQKPSAEEIEAMKEERFSNADADEDGSISKSEFEDMFAKMAENRPPKPEGQGESDDEMSSDDMFSLYDSNGDGTISEEEFSAGEDAMMEKMKDNMSPPPPPEGEGSSGTSSTQSLLDQLLKAQGETEDDEDSTGSITSKQIQDLISSLKGQSAYSTDSLSNTDMLLSLSTYSA